MTRERSSQRYRRWYATLLRFYPRSHYRRFGEGMEQTFSDVLRERADAGRGLLGCALWMSAETAAGIVRMRMTSIASQNRNIVILALVTALILAVPLVAMQFTDDVVWSLGDFIVAGGLLFGTGLAYELIARRAGNIAYLAAIAVGLGAALFLVWANLAVGLIGSEDETANLMYLGVIAVGMVGAAIARLQPPGMARALFAMALAQASVAGIALIAGMHEYAESSVAEIVNVNAFFVALFGLSALLFQRAALASR